MERKYKRKVRREPEMVKDGKEIIREGLTEGKTGPSWS